MATTTTMETTMRHLAATIEAAPEKTREDALLYLSGYLAAMEQLAGQTEEKKGA